MYSKDLLVPRAGASYVTLCTLHNVIHPWGRYLQDAHLLSTTSALLQSLHGQARDGTVKAVMEDE